jgi:hypothetical protein
LTRCLWGRVVFSLSSDLPASRLPLDRPPGHPADPSPDGSPGSPCPRHSRGCSAWHPDHTPQRGVFADDLAELVPVGELVPMEFKTFGGRKLVLIVFPDGKARYETMVGHSADLTLNPTARRRMSAGQEGLIECSSPSAGALIAWARQEAASPEPHLSLTAAQQQTASELPWYREWLLAHGYCEDDLIPFAIA